MLNLHVIEIFPLSDLITVCYWLRVNRILCLMSPVRSPQPRAVNVDLQTDATLQVDISDALSERDKVKFTVHTKVNMHFSLWKGFFVY